MTLVTEIFKKEDLKTVITSGNVGTEIHITGLKPGTVVADGDYIAINTDPTGVYSNSDPVNVPGFTVTQEKAPAPADVTSTPTADGAVINAK